MKTSLAISTSLLLWVGAVTLGTMLQPRTLHWATRSQTDNILTKLLGESRQMFANHFFVKADVYFHSGYYPSIFDQARQAEERENAVAHEGEHEERGHEESGGFGGPPTDWVDRFGRHFRPPRHTHLEGGNIREILPWLRISAELDPHRIETYTVAAYWLRSALGRYDEAEQFLREGLRANPDSYEILYELGRLDQEDRHDATRARNVWKLALRRWHEREDAQKAPDFVAFDAITSHLAKLEEEAGNLAEAIQWLELAKTHSPNSEALQKQIETLRTKLSTSSDRH